MCAYKQNSNQPCETCPRLMTTLYKCDLLKEFAAEIIEDNNRIKLNATK